MKIVAQSQTPTKVGYLHLAYLSAGLQNKIDKGELLPVQFILGLAVAVAVACGALGAEVGRIKGKLVGRALVGAWLGFVVMFGALVLIQAVWSSRQSNDAVVKHVIETRQWWALREAPIAAEIEAATLTNGRAAALAAEYYSMKAMSRTGKEEPELVVKSFKYCQAAAAAGFSNRWVYLTHTESPERLIESFQAALDKRRLSQPDQIWARQQLTELTAQLNKEKHENRKE